MSLLGAHRHGPLRYILIAVVVFWTLSFGMPNEPSSTPLSKRNVISELPPVHEGAPPHATSTIRRDVVDIVRVVDGDTVRIVYEGNEEVVRLIGINAPESVDPRRGVECFGKEASVHLKELLSDTRVVFRADASQSERDTYGRLLGYLVQENGLTINERMIRDGYAYEYTYRVPYEYQSAFRQSERDARTAGLGLFAHGACGLSNITSPVTSTPTSTPSVPVRCDGNYYDCKAFSSQHEAEALFLACGGPGLDPHRLDVDQDGMVCESLP